MKLVRFGSLGRERPGIIDLNGEIRDLSSVVEDFSAQTLSLELIDRLAELDLTQFPRVTEPTRLGPPVSGARNFVGVGLNYRCHAAGINLPAPDEPILFLKSTNTIQGPNDPVILPVGSEKSDWEVELGVVIAKKISNAPESDALDSIFGYCVVNDLSERAFQLERGGTWMKGKSCDTFGPIGPWLITKDEIKNPQSLRLWLKRNGRLMQDGNTENMIFPIPFLISYISKFMTLYPGDIVATGTPDGVGLSQKPEAIYLQRGDLLELGIDGLGIQKQSIK